MATTGADTDTSTDTRTRSTKQTVGTVLAVLSLLVGVTAFAWNLLLAPPALLLGGIARGLAPGRLSKASVIVAGVVCLLGVLIAVVGMARN